MAHLQTEAHHEDAPGLDLLPAIQIAARLHGAQMAALDVVAQSAARLVQAAETMAQTVQSGRRLFYAAAGSSGLMALADAAELPGTFGIAADRIIVLMAGGLPVDIELLGKAEDDTADAMRASGLIEAGDTVIVISASGATPYALTIAREARARGAQVIALANNRDAGLFEHATISIHLATPPELIAGSTRMGAGTAQKAALNIMSTLTGILLGHIHDGMMVNVDVDNNKLRQRATDIICTIAGVGAPEAAAFLDEAGGAVKTAVMLACGAQSITEAEALLAQTHGHLREAMTRM